MGGSSGMGGSGATGANGGTGASGATGGTGGTGGTTPQCKLGPVADLGPKTDERPDLLIVRCDPDRAFVVAGPLGTDAAIYGVNYNGDPDPVDEQGTWTGAPTRIVAGSCDANELRLFGVDSGGLAEFAFPRTGNDLASPLSPTRTDVSTPPTCDVHSLLASYNGGLHYAVQCGTSDLFFGPPATQFTTIPKDAEEPYFYAYSGGIHLILTETGAGWYGADAAQLATKRQTNFEDSATRPTFATIADASSHGFTVVGLTTTTDPNLLPARLFAGPVQPSQIANVFVGGTLPSAVKQLGELTTLDQIGPLSPLATSAKASAFTIVGQDERVYLWSLLNSGTGLLRGLPVREIIGGQGPLEAAASVNDGGIGYVVVWLDQELQGARQYSLHSRSLLCL